jgi:hypothetical protein
MKVIKRKRFIIHKVVINEFERHKQFEIRLPAHVKQVTGIIITAS